LVEQKIREQFGESETVLALIATRHGHIVLAIILALLLLPLMILTVFPGLIWIIYIAARDYGKITRAGGSGGMVVLTVIMSFFCGLIPGLCGLYFWIVFPVCGVRFSFLVRTTRHVALLRFYNIFGIGAPTFSSVLTLPVDKVGITFIPQDSVQPKVILSGVHGERELQSVTWGRDVRDQLRDLAILGTTSGAKGA
jgi:hypothetical protein